MKDTLGKLAMRGRKCQESSVPLLCGNDGGMVELVIQENILRGEELAGGSPSKIL